MDRKELLRIVNDFISFGVILRDLVHLRRTYRKIISSGGKCTDYELYHAIQRAIMWRSKALHLPVGGYKSDWEKSSDEEKLAAYFVPQFK